MIKIRRRFGACDASSASHCTRWTIFRTRRSASVDDASLLKY
jgi:hypothetical protein